MKTHTHFYNNVITIIDKDGKQIDIKRRDDEKYHPQVFQRAANEHIPGLLQGFTMDPNVSSGYDFSCYITAMGYVVFSPFDVNNNDNMLLAFPQIPSKKQMESIQSLLPETRKMNLYVILGSFKNRLENKIRVEHLSGSGSYQEAEKKVKEYFKKLHRVDQMLEETVKQEVDVSKYMSLSKQI